jgi:hypothetical protein
MSWDGSTSPHPSRCPSYHSSVVKVLYCTYCHNLGNRAGWILSARSRPVKGLAEQIADVGEGLADIGRQNIRPGLVSGGFTPIHLYRSSRGGEIFRATAKVNYMLIQESVKDRFLKKSALVMLNQYVGQSG